MTENISIELIGIIAIVATQLGQIAKEIISGSAKKQKKILAIQASNCKRIDEIEIKLEAEEKAMKYLYDKAKENEYREQVQVRIRQIADKIIFANSLNNNDFIAFINQTRDIYISFIDSIIIQDINTLRIETIKTDMITFAKSLKNVSDFEKMCPGSNFYETLKKDVIKPQITIFLMRFKDEILEKKKKYNGDFDAIAVGTIELLITETIKLYRGCKS